ncbi:MAG: ATP-binding domain-containing protein [Alphaproteobacteria bacterium]|nr:ATP-binding domain-containing protein [Alphaproteobacteria bacterium]
MNNHDIAQEILTALENISRIAREAELKPTTFAQNIDAALITDRERKHKQQQGLNVLKSRPASFKFKIKKNNGDIAVYYVSDGYDFSGFPDDSGYTVLINTVPMARNARFTDVGEEIKINGRTFTLLEIEEFTPVRLNNEWDGRNSTFWTDEDGVEKKFSSLRNISEPTQTHIFSQNSFPSSVHETEKPSDKSNSFFETASTDNHYKTLAEILEEDITPQKNNIIAEDNFEEQALTYSRLGTLLFLDKIQTEISSKPLDLTFVLMGPPGTGKTTTLIRRLKQQMSDHNDDNEVADVIENIEKSWIIFTPTKLLREYLKNAVNRESIPVSDDNVKTWNDFSTSFARQFFLRTTQRPSGLIRNESDVFFSENVSDKIAFFNNFYKWQNENCKQRIKQEINDLITLYSSGKTKVLSLDRFEFGHRKSITEDDIETVIRNKPTNEKTVDIKDFDYAIRNLCPSENQSLSQIMENLFKFSVNGEIQQILETYTQWIRRINEEIRNKGGKVTDYRERINKYVAEKEIDLSDDNSEIADEKELREAKIRLDSLREEIEEKKRREGNNKETERMVKECNSLEKEIYIAEVRNAYKKYEEMRKKYEDWKIESDQKTQILKDCLEKITFLKSAIDNFALNIAESYKTYIKQKFGKERKDISSEETDLLILSILKFFRSFSQPKFRESNKYLNDFYKSQSKIQIFVDEMTDFSPFQIACMKKLSSKSFFAEGDFNQRLTSYGCSTLDELKWALEKPFDSEEIKINYRLSPKLNYLAAKILKLKTTIDISSREYQKAPSPVWLKNASNLQDTAKWIVEKINEIENHYKELPSIAVLVNSEQEVQPLANLLTEEGRDYNLSVEACLQGQAVGTAKIRVFDIHHIKGLEFEGVFFISADHINENDIDMTRYLYVGTTRATNYLGITTVGKNLPFSLTGCENLFSNTFHSS